MMRIMPLPVVYDLSEKQNLHYFRNTTLIVTHDDEGKLFFQFYANVIEARH